MDRQYLQTDKGIIRYIIINKENRRKTLLNIRKVYPLIGSKYKFLIHWTAEGNQINIIYDINDYRVLKEIYLYNRTSETSLRFIKGVNF